MSIVGESVEIRAPSSQEEGTRSQVLRWLKAVGDRVSEHEPLLELETDKVTVEVAAPGAGVLAQILKQEQEEVAPGELLGRIGPAAAIPRQSDPAASISAASSPSSSNLASGNPGAQGAALRTVSAPARADALASDSDSGAPARLLSPAVRRLLAEHSLDAASIRGTGEGGRITVTDVMREAADPSPSARTGAPVAAAPRPRVDTVDTPSDSNGMEGAASHRVPHSGVRKRIAARMVESLLHTAPHVTTVFEVDMGAVLGHRQRHRDEFARRGVTLTLTAYFAQAAVTAIGAVPEANSRWMDAGLDIYDTINLGVATAAEAGLVVPVLHHIETLDLLETARRLEDLVRRARDGGLTPAEVRGGTFTLSNHGVSGSLLAAPIIIPQPQSAILGLGKLEKRAVVIEHDGADEIVVRSRCYATLTIDHRVMDGSRANRFLQAFTEQLSGWKD
ncbi:MAG TPA: 2-oxo acid dehydrogenase subunit E2 [Steroidobacteraceae bacterium]|jgi:2-oxoglutarate dehydrogenase E2 component (dihydrolipoamide succinyltransferase)|nr:2-oxo acid dehydrogenase subunit E2 [Steroidobacteraceae bacterium]